MKVNKPEFIIYQKLGHNLDFDGVANTASYIERIAAQVADTTDRLIMEAITETAKKEGITDLYILDKNNVVTALKKQIPRKVRYLNRHGKGCDWRNEDYYNCPACGRRLRNKQHDPYCPKCGQALDWRQEE